MKKQLLIAVAAVVLIGAAVFGIASTSSDDGELKVAATIFPLYDITKNIAGDDIEVVQMLPAGASPHTFDPQPSLVSELEGTDIVFSIGNGLENWADNLTESVGAESVVVDSGIELRDSVEGEHGHDEEKEDEHSDEEGHEHEDEEEHSDEEEGHEHEEGEEGHDEHGHDEEEKDEDEHGHAHGPTDPHNFQLHQCKHLLTTTTSALHSLIH